MFPCTPHRHLWSRNSQCAGPGNGRPLTATLLMTVAFRSERVRRRLWRRSARCCGVPWRTEWSPWWLCGPAESGHARDAAAAVPPLCVCGRVYVGTCASCWSWTPWLPPSADFEVGTAASGSGAESRREMEYDVNCLLFFYGGFSRFALSQKLNEARKKTEYFRDCLQFLWQIQHLMFAF